MFISHPLIKQPMVVLVILIISIVSPGIPSAGATPPGVAHRSSATAVPPDHTVLPLAPTTYQHYLLTYQTALAPINRQPSPHPASSLTVSTPYTLTDSYSSEAVIYDWIDVTDGMTLTMAEDGKYSFDMPFPFVFAGTVQQKVWVGDNGGISFDSDTSLPYNNQALKNRDDKLIVPFWDDLDSRRSPVFYKKVGTAPYRRLVIAWVDRPHYETSYSPESPGATFELILYETTNNIKFQYQNVFFDNEAWDGGASATVGILNQQYSFNEATLENEFALCFQHPSAHWSCDVQPVEQLTITRPPWQNGIYTDETYRFKVRAAPLTARLPITYTWQATDYITSFVHADRGLADSASFRWQQPDRKIITVTAQNALNAMPGAKPATVTTTVTVDQPAVSFAQDTYTVTEKVGTASLAVVLQNAPPYTATVTCQVSDGTAQETTDDYASPVTSTIKFPPGRSEGYCQIPIGNDDQHEQNETVNLKLSNPQPAKVLLDAPHQAILTITDDDPEIYAGFSTDKYSVSEDGGSTEITVMLSKPFHKQVTIDYTTANGSALAKRDYQSVSGTLTFAISETTKTFRVPILSDTALEGHETVELYVQNPSGGLQTRSDHATLVITDNLPPGSPAILQFSAPSYVVDEKIVDETTNQSIAHVRVECIGDIKNEVSAEFITFDATATRKRDYTTVQKRLHFTPEKPFQEVRIPIIDDQEGEGDETILLLLSNIAGKAELGTQHPAILTIQDNDVPPQGVIQFTNTEYQVDEEGGSVMITVSRSGGVSGTASVEYGIATQKGSATAGEDYKVITDTLNFFAGQNLRTFSLPILPDGITEGDETVVLRLYNPDSAVLGSQQQTTVKIIDDDLDAYPSGIIQFRSAAYYTYEESEQAIILVDRIGGNTGTVSADYATVDDTVSIAARSIIDYAPVAGRLVFDQGVTSRSFLIAVKPDTLTEGRETVRLALSNPRLISPPPDNGQANRLTATGTQSPTIGTQDEAILNIDEQRSNPSGVFGFTQHTYQFLESTGTVSITVDRGNNTDGVAQVAYTIASTTNMTGVLQFASGSRYQEILLDLPDVSTEEQTATSKLHLSTFQPGAELDPLYKQAEVVTHADVQSTEPPDVHASLTTSSHHVQEGQQILLIANITEPSGTILAQPLTDVFVKIGLDSVLDPEHIQLRDDGTQGDFLENDGLYTAFWQVPSNVNKTNATLVINGEEVEDSTIVLQVNDTPELLILTDWQELYQEFLRMGMDTIFQEDDYLPDKNIHDFFDLVARVHRYARDHEGIVVNIHDISSQYKDSTEQRRLKSTAIDVLIEDYSNISAAYQTIDYVVLLGNDAVVPFYRVYDPSDFYGRLTGTDYQSLERDYKDNIADQTNADIVLEDMSEAYIMSDLPYSIRARQEITQDTWKTHIPEEERTNIPTYTNSLFLPRPDMGIGRILAATPAALITAIEHYERPINLSQTASSSAIFFSDEEFVHLSDKRGAYDIFAPLRNWLSNTSERLKEYRKEWTPDDIVTNLSSATLNAWRGHGTHKNFNEVTSTHLQNVGRTEPGIWIGLGCHLGWSTGCYTNAENTTCPRYQEALVNPLIEKGITIFAPSAHSYSYRGFYDKPSLNETMVRSFITNLLHGDVSDMGTLWQATLADYHYEEPALIEGAAPATDLFHANAAYGMLLYGLPTQRIDRSETTDPAPCTPVAAAELAQSPVLQEQTITFESNIPNIGMQQLEDGSTLFSIINGGTHIVPPNGPPLPMIVWSRLLPKNQIVTNVDITIRDEDKTQLPDTFKLPQPVLQTSNRDVISGTYDLPPVYPQQVYTYTVTPHDEGWMLSVQLIPLQYESATQRITLFEKVRGEISLLNLDSVFEQTSFQASLAQTPALANAAIDDDSLEVQPTPLQKGQAVSFTVTIQNNQARRVNLRWITHDFAGSPVLSGKVFNLPLDTASDTTTFQCTLADAEETSGWLAGEKNLTVYVENTNQPVVTGFQVQGPIIQDARSPDREYDQQQEQEIRWRIAVYDANAWPIEGLTENDILLELHAASSSALSLNTSFFGEQIGLAGNSLPYTLTEETEGRYELAVLLDDIPQGKHVLRARVVHEEVESWRDWNVTVRRPLVYLPLIRK
jgi:hypothetical protein